jgi:hypothetical protein
VCYIERDTMTKRLLVLICLIGLGSIAFAQSELIGKTGPDLYKPNILIKVDTSYFIADTAKLKNADVKWFRKRHFVLKPEKYKMIFDAPVNEFAVVLTLKRRYYEKLLKIK